MWTKTIKLLNTDISVPQLGTLCRLQLYLSINKSLEAVSHMTRWHTEVLGRFDLKNEASLIVISSDLSSSSLASGLSFLFYMHIVDRKLRDQFCLSQNGSRRLGN